MTLCIYCKQFYLVLSKFCWCTIVLFGLNLAHLFFPKIPACFPSSLIYTAFHVPNGSSFSQNILARVPLWDFFLLTFPSLCKGLPLTLWLYGIQRDQEVYPWNFHSYQVLGNLKWQLLRQHSGNSFSLFLSSISLLWIPVPQILSETQIDMFQEQWMTLGGNPVKHCSLKNTYLAWNQFVF